ncbi:carbohydrate ABC transporter permease [Halanaerobium kushneri]|uniref:Raffinose/stachyose/melibiose transport system permease protein n=1 Tax=Halanaerobium kushneri TaxID=56779 RepID=A0A1N6RXK7_9FIRM|nr:raffinose/stachyose/melibiose transport system permease protein [Halanaerobium kushneri]
MEIKSFKQIKFTELLVYIVLFIYLIFTLFPLLMSFLNSVKTEGEIMNSIISLPSKLQFKNYITAFQKINFLRSLWNTLVVTSIGVSGIVLFGSMAGYKLSRNSGKLSSLIFGLFVMSMLIPFHSIMITLTSISKNLRIQGSTVGLGLIYIGLGVPMAIFLYHGFTKSIPREIEEAAIIDGCGELQLFFKVIFPLLRPISATVMILNTLWIWNDFLLPLLMLVDSDHYTLLLSTNMLFGRYNNDWSSILAALILAMLPVVIIYLLLQKNIVKGVADGAIKG